MQLGAKSAFSNGISLHPIPKWIFQTKAKICRRLSLREDGGLRNLSCICAAALEAAAVCYSAAIVHILILLVFWTCAYIKLQLVGSIGLILFSYWLPLIKVNVNDFNWLFKHALLVNTLCYVFAYISISADFKSIYHCFCTMLRYQRLILMLLRQQMGLVERFFVLA